MKLKELIVLNESYHGIMLPDFFIERLENVRIELSDMGFDVSFKHVFENIDLPVLNIKRPGPVDFRSDDRINIENLVNENNLVSGEYIRNEYNILLDQLNLTQGNVDVGFTGNNKNVLFLDNIGLDYSGLHELPKILRVINQDHNTICDGDFDCSRNYLTSLVGCPKSVNGDFSCDHQYNGHVFTEEDVRSVCHVRGRIYVD